MNWLKNNWLALVIGGVLGFYVVPVVVAKLKPATA